VPAPKPFVYAIADVVRVVDGDTIEATIDLGFSTLRKVTIRLAGLDAPERKGPSKHAAQLVASFVSRWFRCGERYIGVPKGYVLESTALDKYGRSLGRVYRDNTAAGVECLNDVLIKLGYALPYDGCNRAGTWTKAKLAAIDATLNPTKA
jgi:micrococcal nuclease